MAQSKINPMDGFYSWGYIGGSTVLISKGEQIKEKIEGAFDSIEIKEDEETPALDYVLKVNGNEQGRIVIPVDMVVKDAYYDDETKEVVIVVRVGEDEEKEIRFSVADLIDVYSGDEVTIHMEDKVFSISEDVMDKFDTLEGAISDEQTRAEAAEQANADTIAENKTAIEANTDAISKVEADYQTADAELEEKFAEKTKNMVEWQYSTEERKHIVLGNHENMLGTATNGSTYNIAMVSKWDVADFGSSQLPLNLNAKDGKVTVNDNDEVITTKNVIPLSAIEDLFK